jgi:stringent starvation protein B
MTSSRPYLLRALYEWISDNKMTPYILVDAEQEGVIVPTDFVEKGKIVLNISLNAVQNLSMGNSLLELSARFHGKTMLVSVPVSAILAIYAQENGKGMVFNEEDNDEPPPEKAEDEKPAKPHLHVVK